MIRQEFSHAGVIPSYHRTPVLTQRRKGRRQSERQKVYSLTCRCQHASERVVLHVRIFSCRFPRTILCTHAVPDSGSILIKSHPQQIAGCGPSERAQLDASQNRCLISFNVCFGTFTVSQLVCGPNVQTIICLCHCLECCIRTSTPHRHHLRLASRH